MKLAAAAAMTWLAIAIPAVAETPSPQPSPSQAPAAAPSARSLELADRLIEVMRLRKQMSDAWGALGPVMMEQEIKRNPNLTADQRKVIMEAANETIAVMYDKLVERAAPLYASAFTEAEMSTLIDFYGSPVGQSLLDKTPRLAAATSELVKELLPETETEMFRRLCAKTDCFGQEAEPPKQSPS